MNKFRRAMPRSSASRWSRRAIPTTRRWRHAARPAATELRKRLRREAQNKPSPVSGGGFANSERMHRERADDDSGDQCQRAVDGKRMQPPLCPRGQGARTEMEAGFRRKLLHGRSPTLHVRHKRRSTASGCNIPRKIAIWTLSPEGIAGETFSGANWRENILRAHWVRSGPNPAL